MGGITHIIRELFLDDIVNLLFDCFHDNQVLPIFIKADEAAGIPSLIL